MTGLDRTAILSAGLNNWMSAIAALTMLRLGLGDVMRRCWPMGVALLALGYSELFDGTLVVGPFSGVSVGWLLLLLAAQYQIAAALTVPTPSAAHPDDFAVAGFLAEAALATAILIPIGLMVAMTPPSLVVALGTTLGLGVGVGLVARSLQMPWIAGFCTAGFGIGALFNLTYTPIAALLADTGFTMVFCWIVLLPILASGLQKGRE